jgi:hypothetical protein
MSLATVEAKLNAIINAAKRAEQKAPDAQLKLLAEQVQQLCEVVRDVARDQEPGRAPAAPGR